MKIEASLQKKLWIAYAAALSIAAVFSYVELGRLCQGNQLTIPTNSFLDFLLPVTACPRDAAWSAWCIVSTVALAVTLALLTQGDLFKKPLPRTIAVISALASYPVWLCFRTADIALLMPAVMAAFWFWLRKKQYLWAGVLSSLFLIKIGYLPMVAAVGFVLGTAGFTVGVSVSTLAVIGGALLLCGSDLIPLLVQINKYLVVSPEAGAMPPSAMQNFHGELAMILGGETQAIFLASLAILVIATICVAELWMRLKRFALSEAKFLKAASATILFMLIATPHTQAQDYIAVCPAAIWLWIATEGDKRDAALSIRKFIIAFPILSWLFLLLEPIFLIIRVAPFFCWATALAVLTLTILEDKK